MNQKLNAADEPYGRAQSETFKVEAFDANASNLASASAFLLKSGLIVTAFQAVEGAVPLVEVVYDSGSGDVKHDRTGQVVSPSFPYANSRSAGSGDPRTTATRAQQRRNKKRPWEKSQGLSRFR